MAGEKEPELTVQLGATYLCRKSDGTYQDVEVVKMRTNKRAQREEYMVRFTGSTRRQTEWVDKTRLTLQKPQQDEDPEEGNVQEVPESGQEPDEDEPETKKAKVEDPGAASERSEKTGAVLGDDLTCLLCGKPSEDSVTVECGHSFCRGCIDKAWGTPASFKCPHCKRVLTKKRYSTNQVPVNMASETFHMSAPEAGDTPAQPEKSAPSNYCADHGERINFYCKDDGNMCCIICQDSLKHKSHRFLHVQEAVGMCRAELPGTINSMEEALDKLKERIVAASDNVEKLKADISECKQHIVSNFDELYVFLEEQKKKLLEQLKQQGQGMLDEMETSAARCDRSGTDLQESLEMANEKVKDTNPYSFLNDVKSFLETVQEQRQTALSCREILREGELCQGTFKGPLQYIIWKQMKSVVGSIPECDEPLKTTPVVPPQEKGSVKEQHSTKKPEESKKEPGKIEEAAVEAPEAPPVKEQHSTEPKPEESRKEPEIIEEAAAEAPEAPPDVEKPHPPMAITPSQPVPARTPAPLEDFSDLNNKGHKEIWVVGEAFLEVVKRAIDAGPYAKNLGFPESICHVNWIEAQHNLWSQLLAKLQIRASYQQEPDILFVHTGSQELRQADRDALRTCASKVLSSLVKYFPKLSIVLSTILPKKEWQGTPMEKSRKIFNKALCHIALNFRFQVVKHEEMEASLFQRFGSENKVRLKAPEVNAFIKDLRDALINELRGTGRLPKKGPAQQKATLTSPIAANKAQPVKKVESVTVKGCDQQPKPGKSKEDPVEEAPAEVPKAPPAPLQPPEDFSDLMDKGRKEIWICGDGFLVSSKRLAVKGQDGKNLGIPESVCRISWLRKPYKQWSELCSKLQEVASNTAKPDVLFVYLGSHELAQTDSEPLKISTLTALYTIVEGFPETSIVLSTLLPRKDWQGTAQDQRRKVLNAALCQFAEKNRFQILKHEDLEPALIERFDEEGDVCIDEAGLQMFNKSLRNALLKELRNPRKVPENGPGQQRPPVTSPVAGKKVEPVSHFAQPHPAMVIQPSHPTAEPKCIWIAGNAYIYRAYGHAGKCKYGTSLGFKHLNWHCLWLGRATRWHRLVPELLKSVDTRGTPSAIFIHLGTEDLELVGCESLINDMTACLGRLVQLYPFARILLSPLLPKKEWLGNPLEAGRKKFNAYLKNYAAMHRFQVASHDKLEQQLLFRFLRGGVTSLDSFLTVAENDQFIGDIRQLLLKAMFMV